MGEGFLAFALESKHLSERAFGSGGLRMMRGENFDLKRKRLTEDGFRFGVEVPRDKDFTQSVLSDQGVGVFRAKL